MSALTKPHIHPTGTINGEGDIVNIEEVMSVTPVTALKPAGVNSQDKFWIVFQMRGHNNNPKEVVWRYADEAGRDTSLGNIKTLASTAIA